MQLVSEALFSTSKFESIETEVMIKAAENFQVAAIFPLHQVGHTLRETVCRVTFPTVRPGATAGSAVTSTIPFNLTRLSPEIRE